MKKIGLALIASLLIVPSCVKELETIDNTGEPAGETTVITAGFEGAKTALQSDSKKIYWTSGDAICVNGVTSETLSLAEPAATATFTFASALTDEKKAVYPASIWTSDGTVTLPALQDAGDNVTFASGALPLVAYAASGNTLSFKSMLAIIKLQLKKGATDDNIAYVEFSGRNGEQVSGAFSVNYSTGALTGTSVADADKKVQVTVGKALSSTPTVIYIAVPAGTYSNGFKIKVVDVNDVTMTKYVGAITLNRGSLYPTPVDTFDADNTIKAFVKSYVNILKIWERTTGTIDLLKGEDYAGGSYNVTDAHYVPSTTTITVGEKTYNTADMLETAMRSYLLVRGYNGLDTESKGAGSIAALAGGAVGMSETTVPPTHDYYWGSMPYNETAGNGGYFRTTGGVSHIVTTDVLDNWAMRALNFQHGQSISNMCTYPGGGITTYTGSFCSMRALLTYASFFKYMLDNGYDKGTQVLSDAIIHTDLFTTMPDPEDNHNGIWLWSTHMTTVDLDDLASKGIKNIILNEAAFTSHGRERTMSFMDAAHARGMRVHIWLQCFYDGSWIRPVDNENVCYKQDLFDEIIERAVNYVGYGADGIHLDYVRFPGDASSYNPSPSVTATGAITEFCRQMNVAVKAKNSSTILSAALMPEKYSEAYYGQDPSQMGAYIDIFMPMIYYRCDGYRTSGGESWATDIANHFAIRGAPAKVWAGFTTYYDTDGEKTVPMSASQIRYDAELFAGTSAEGVVLFRYNIGDLPDLTDLWD